MRQMREDIESFLSYLQIEKGFSENTIAAYKNDLNQMADWAEEDARRRNTVAAWTDYNRQSMLSYMLWLKGRNYATTTLARKVAAAKSFFDFMLDEGRVTRDPTDDLPAPKIGRSLPKSISSAQALQLLEQPYKLSSLEAHRDRAMLQLLYATGMRVSELIALNMGDVDLTAGSVRCLGKGRKERLIPIHHKASLATQE